jgi:leader peptidase (prepilin peptidase)/N-methyltransferase
MPILVIIIFFFLGAVLASFTTVIAERIYTGQSFWSGRSRCNSCARTLSGLDLVPIFSWLLWRGRCRTCRAHVPFLYTAGEAILGTVFALAAYTYGNAPIVLGLFLLFSIVLFFVVIYDLRHMIVPLWSSAALIVLGAVFAFLRYPQASLLSILEVAAAIALGFFLLYFFSKGRAMGLGDTPVAFAAALFAGPQAFPGLLYSFWIGALVGILILLRRRGGPTIGIEVPFVPFLALGFLLAIFTQWNPLVF